MAACYKLHGRVINDLTELLDNHSNLALASTGIIYADNTLQNPLNQPISLELSVLADLRVVAAQEITVSNSDGYEVYKCNPVLIDDLVTTAAAIPVSWGQVTDAPATYAPSAHNQDWSTINTGRPTTLAGYGISDAFTQAVADARYPQLSIQYTNPTWLAGVDATIIKTGTIDLARLPAMPSANTVVCTTIPAMSAGDQSLVAKGTVVIESTTGNTYRYSGTGSVVLNASYIQQSDLTPDWAVITNKPTLVSTWANDAGYLTGASSLAWNKLTGVPTTFAPSAHTHVIADTTGLQAALDGKQAGSSVLTSIAAQSSGTGLLKLAAGVASLDSSVYALASSVPVASSTTPASLGTAAVGTGTAWARADHVHAMPTAVQVGAEPALGNPGTSGFLLSSTTAGVRSWVAPYSHPASHPQSVVDSASGWITTALAGKQASLGFTPVQQGGGTSQTTSKLYIGWSAGSALRLQVDSTDFGSTWPIAISGASADSAKLGGQLPSYYALESTIAHTGTGAVDPNTLTNLQSGFTQNTAANRPGNYAFVQTLGRYNGGSMQIASDSYGSDSNSLWWRRKGDNGTWYTWKTIWHTGNLTGDQVAHYHSSDRAWANITGVPANVQNPQNYFLPLGNVSGTATRIPVFTGTNSLGDSLLIQDSTWGMIGVKQAPVNGQLGLTYSNITTSKAWQNVYKASDESLHWDYFNGTALTTDRMKLDSAGNVTVLGRITTGNGSTFNGDINVTSCAYITYSRVNATWSGSGSERFVVNGDGRFVNDLTLGSNLLLPSTTNAIKWCQASTDVADRWVEEVGLDGSGSDAHYLCFSNNGNVATLALNQTDSKFASNLSVAGSLSVGGSLYLGQASMGSWVASPTTYGWFGHAVRNQNDWSGLLANNTGSVWLGCLANQTVKLNYGGADQMILGSTGFDFKSSMKGLDHIVSYKGASDTLGAASRIGVTNSNTLQGWLFGYGASKDLQLWESATDNSWTLRYRFTGLQMKLPIYAVVGNPYTTIAAPLYDAEVRLYRGNKNAGACYLRCRAITEMVRYRSDTGVKGVISTAGTDVPVDVQSNIVMLIWSNNGTDGYWTMLS